MLKRIVLYIFLFTVTYLYINNPLFVFTGGSESIRWLYFLFPFAIIIKFSLFRKYLSSARPFVIIFVMIVLYLTFVMLSGGETRYYTKNLASAIEDVLLPFIFIVIFYLLKITEKQFVSFLLVFGSACALLSFLCIINPSIASYFRESVSVGNDYLDTHLYRGFGLSYSLTYAYGITLGIILVAGFNYFSNNKWFVFAAPFILISIILNARTGVVVAALGLLCAILVRRKVSSFLITPLLLIVLLYAFTRLVSSANLSEGSMVFMEDFVDAIGGYISGEDAGAISVLRSQWRMPDTVEDWLVGQGIDIYKLGGNMHSDIGFFIQLNYGGLFYLGLLLLLVAIVARFFFENKEYFWGYFFIATFLIANYKGQFLLTSGCFRLFIMIMTFYIYKQIVQVQGKGR